MRGDVWFADLEHVIGSEQGRSRPVIVITNDEYNRRAPRVVVVVPITRTERGFPTHLELAAGSGGLDYRSFAMTEQTRVVSIQRLGRRLGRLDRITMRALSDVLTDTFDLWPDD